MFTRKEFINVINLNLGPRIGISEAQIIWTGGSSSSTVKFKQRSSVPYIFRQTALMSEQGALGVLARVTWLIESYRQTD